MMLRDDPHLPEAGTQALLFDCDGTLVETMHLHRMSWGRIFERYSAVENRNPTLAEIAEILSGPEAFSDALISPQYALKVAQGDYQDLSGLKDQVSSLTSGPLKRILSPKGGGDIRLEDAARGTVLYFRLQSLISPKLVSSVGKLIVNNLNYLAGRAHRGVGAA